MDEGDRDKTRIDPPPDPEGGHVDLPTSDSRDRRAPDGQRQREEVCTAGVSALSWKRDLLDNTGSARGTESGLSGASCARGV